MADSVEIPEANDHFEKRVALSIAAVAVVLAFIATKGDNAKGDALLAATRASSQWAYFQAKSMKEHSYAIQKELLGALPQSALDRDKLGGLIKSYEDKIHRYEAEKQVIMADAEKLEAEVKANGEINDRADMAGLILQIAIVLSSIAILVHWPLFWFVSLGLSVLGTAVGMSAFFM